MAGRKAALSAKGRAFAMEYVWGDYAGNASRCVEIAGFKCASDGARRNLGYELLRKPAVKALVDAETAERERQLKGRWLAGVERALDVVEADPGDAFDEAGAVLPLQPGLNDAKGEPRRMPRHVRRAVASIEVETRQDGHGEDAETYTVTKLKFLPPQQSAEFLARLAGKLKDKVEVEGTLTLEQLVLAADRLAKDKRAESK